MIETLKQVNTSKSDIPAEVWQEWESSKATKHFKQYIKGEIIEALNKLVSSKDQEASQFCRGQIQALDLTLSYKPENVND